jgi:hypoxanthine-guanine phosphoribosyltransferase
MNLIVRPNLTSACVTYVCALLLKEGLQEVDLDLRYVGFSIPPAFVVGYGLDLAERWRNLPCIRVLEPPGSEDHTGP